MRSTKGNTCIYRLEYIITSECINVIKIDSINNNTGMWDISNINLIEPIIWHRNSSQTTVHNKLKASWRTVHPLHPPHKRESVMWFGILLGVMNRTKATIQKLLHNGTKWEILPYMHYQCKFLNLSKPAYSSQCTQVTNRTRKSTWHYRKLCKVNVKLLHLEDIS